MAKKKHTLFTTHDHDYTLIVIKTALEDFRLAYFLNGMFNLELKKEKFRLSFQSDKGEFNVFGFENLNNNQYWALIANKQVIDKEVDGGDNYNLFEEISNTYVLINEEKKVDYFLKIENNNINLTTLIKKINTIHRVITSYEIDPNNLKSRDLLIF